MRSAGGVRTLYMRHARNQKRPSARICGELRQQFAVTRVDLVPLHRTSFVASPMLPAWMSPDRP